MATIEHMHVVDIDSMISDLLTERAEIKSRQRDIARLLHALRMKRQRGVMKVDHKSLPSAPVERTEIEAVLDPSLSDNETAEDIGG